LSAEEIYSASSLSTDASGAIEDMVALAALSWASRLNFFSGGSVVSSWAFRVPSGMIHEDLATFFRK